MTAPPLLGQVAVISGGGGAIGSAIALELARLGADIAVGDNRDGGAGELLEGIRELGRRCRFDAIDVTDSGGVARWIDLVDQDLGAPTLIIPNAAIVSVGPFLTLDPGHWRRELAVNLDGAFHVASAACRNLVSKGLRGRVVFVGSWAAAQVHPQIPTYCVAKAGVRMLMRCMAAELARHGILVNEVAPGFVDAGLGTSPDESAEQREATRRQVPVGELSSAVDVAAQVAYLCDPNNRHITGSTLLMDGGLSLLGRPPD